MARSFRRLPLAVLIVAIPVAGLLTLHLVARPGTGPVRATSQADTVQKGPVPGTYGNHWTTTPDPPLPTTGPPNECGMWSAQTSADALAVQAAHGTIESCELIGDTWIVTTQGGPGSQIGELGCAPTDTTCMNGWDAKNLTAFTWVVPPPPITFITIVAVQGDTIGMITNNGQWTFDIDTGTWARMSMTFGAGTAGGTP
jgi:hypothetical protein